MGILVASLALLAVQADPLDREEFKAAITLAVKRTLVKPFLDQITAKTGVRFSLVGTVSVRKLTVFAQDKPVKDLLHEVADVFGWRFGSSGNALTIVDADRFGREGYWKAEVDYEYAESCRRLNALASIVRSQPYKGSGGVGGPKAVVRPYTEGEPEKWAQEAVGELPYYVLGCWWATLGEKRWEVVAAAPHYFMIDAAYPGLDQRIDAIRAMLPHWQALRGSFIAIRYHMDNGDIQVAHVESNEWPRPPKVLPPYRYASPPPQLAKNKFAAQVLGWPTEIPPSLNEVELKEAEKVESGFSGARVGLAEFAEEIHRRTGRTVVADDFRLPMLEVPDAKIEHLGPYLAHLRDKCKVFVRLKGDDILLRHPAFWALEKSEPSEEATLRLEQLSTQRALTLDDYASYAASVGRNQVRALRFLRPDRMLTRFNARPLREAGP